MSTSPNPPSSRADDRIVQLCSRWLARHIGNGELEQAIREIGLDELKPGQRAAVEELLEILDQVGEERTGELEVILRETIEALAVGV